MKKIAEKLMDYGMDFQYENNGSQGEKITSFDLNVLIYTHQGELVFDHDGEVEELEDNEKSIDYLVLRLDEIAIAETT